MWKLVIEDDEGKRTVVPLTRDDYTIGRQEGNTIRLTERNVSRAHGRVRRARANGAPPLPGAGGARDTFVLEDLRSYNGVFVNGLRVAHTQDLQHGDLIQIGDYRIVLQDDAVSAIETAAIPVTVAQTDDAKMTMPLSAAYRGQTLTDRPNRMVMLVGPTPGVEYPLDRERMTVGRAEDATISVNHNSVSRLHCEIHALGDGRFEIVDKGSSNGVRVNAVELKRSIIEAGDVIELGDVRFKFVGAGQVFVAGPNESQQLTAISDRDAELADPKKKGGLGGFAGPIIGAGFVGAALIVGIVWFMRQRAPGPEITPSIDQDQAIITEAKKSCTVDDCEAAHQAVNQLPEGSQWRKSADFAQIEGMWAESILRKAKTEADPTTRRALLQRLATSPTADPNHRKQAGDLLQAIVDVPGPSPTDLPQAPNTAKDAGMITQSSGNPVQSPSPTAPTQRPTPTSHTTVTNATTPPPPTTPPTTPPKPPAGGTPLERAQKAALDGQPAAVRNILETRVMSGHASPEEARLLRAACKQMGDVACAEAVRAKYPSQ
jgi:ABC transport system ATP-binding/permease protein